MAKIYLLKEKPTLEQIRQMSEVFKTYIKLAVDIERRVVAGGGAMHADCEALLLDNGSVQKDVWGADWVIASQEVQFESLINIRPTQGNFKMEVTDPLLRQKIEEVAREMFEGIC